uniref:Trichome birefringence-like C-terminal domain-containing protein n=1 Tax=Solanum lycopersicum TaxID=4081 RepID=K4CBH1_SOLLC
MLPELEEELSFENEDCGGGVTERQLPVVLLNITQSINFRKDDHPSVYEKIGRRAKQDCGHWCLPGVPDEWNELICATFCLFVF